MIEKAEGKILRIEKLKDGLINISKARLRMYSLLLYLLNVIDYFLTVRLVFGLGFGPEVEGNKLVAYAFQTNPIIVFIYKIFLVGLFVLFLYKSRDKMLARIGIIFLLGVYTLLLF